MCTNFYGSVFTVENLFSITPECSLPHLGQTRWSRLRFRLDKNPALAEKRVKTPKNLFSLFQCLYHVAYYSNGLHVITPCSRVRFGKSIAAGTVQEVRRSMQKQSAQ